MKAFLVVLFLFLTFFGYNFFKEYNRSRQLNAEIKKLEAVAKEIEAKNLDILNLAKYLDTEEFLEEEARTKLGMQKPGEQTVIVSFPNSGEHSTSSPQKNNKKTAPNYLEWWKHFFEKR